MNSQIPDYIVSIPEIVNQKCSGIISWIQKTPEIKSDGAIDEIPLKENKTLVKVKDIYINTRTQRVDNIETTNIIKNLSESKGFSHRVAGTIDTFIHRKTNIDSTPDGLHRAIMAYICGVEYIAVTRQDEHPINSTEDEMIEREYNFFLAKNELNAKVKETSKNRVNKLSGKMTKEQKKLDDACAETNIHINEYGVSKNDALLIYPDGHKNMISILNDEKHHMHIGVKSFKKLVSFLKSVTTKRTQLDCAIAWAYNSLKDDDKSLFKKYLKSNQYYSRNIQFWTGKNQHGYGMEAACIRLLVCFNEWYRAKFDEDIINIHHFDSFINKMGTETHHFLYSCLIEKNPVNESLLSFEIKEKELSNIL